MAMRLLRAGRKWERIASSVRRRDAYLRRGSFVIVFIKGKPGGHGRQAGREKAQEAQKR